MDHVSNRKTAFRKIEKLGIKFQEHSINPISLPAAKKFVQIIQDSWKQVEEKHALAVAACLDDDGKDDQQATYEAMFETYCKVEGDAMDVLSSLHVTAVGPSTIPPAGLNIKLPVMDLPTFDGNIDDWRSFKDLFSATVGNNTHLSGAVKLQYLKTALKGKALDQISSLSTIDAHYKEAWKILTEKYENTREIVHSVIRKLLDFKCVKGESSSELQALLDNTNKCLKSLKVLGLPVEHWDDLIVVNLVGKLDAGTRREWAIRQTGTDLPKLKELQEFLMGHIRGLQAIGSSSSVINKTVKFEKGFKVHHVSAEQLNCSICTKPHLNYKCQELLSKQPADRNGLVRKLRLCFNCIGAGHTSRECPSSGTCRQCGHRHHSILHITHNGGLTNVERMNHHHEGNKRGTTSQRQEASSGHSQPSRIIDSKMVESHHVTTNSSNVLMTAIVSVKDNNGCTQPCRVFIDPGSQGDFVTEEFVRRLGIPRRASNVKVTGVGGVSAGQVRGVISTTLYSANNNHSLPVTLFVLSKVTSLLPSSKLVNGRYPHLSGLELADPLWFRPGSVDILLGIKHYHKIKLAQKRVGVDENDPVAWETIFGWVVSGSCATVKESISTFHLTIEEVDNFIRQFWEVEEPPKAKILTVQEKICEEHFVNNVSRTSTGQFVVGIPFNEMKTQLGASRHIAVNRFLQVEKKLQRQPHFRQQYIDFMREYIELGHMIKVNNDKEIIGETLHLCHHGVTNDSSTTTKMRVVFDGSAKTSSGLSLNDALYVGATVQDDLYDILLRFRTNSIVIKADIAKMFRQFLLNPHDSKYHRIVWRESPDVPLEDYELLTVTYGTACAPNLATRCLQELAIQSKEKYPLASKVLLTNTYVDDILTSVPSKEEAVKLYTELCAVVQSAGMELRKWTTNDQDVLKVIPEHLREMQPTSFETKDQLVKALGIQWDPTADIFTFRNVSFKFDGRVTKRNLYSDLSKVFDPLGLVSCVTIRGKLLLQRLWCLAIGWDEAVPDDVQELWDHYKNDLYTLVKVAIPRKIDISPYQCELHCYSDSSERAFGCTCYVRSVYADGSVKVTFVTSKTRVAPLKQVSLPRLELCGALVGAQVAAHVMETLSKETKTNMDLFMWSDSTITINWIKGEANRWKTYVRNRVAEIQSLTPQKCWSHVPGLQNPADLASRGITAEEICDNDFWWKGPEWLSKPVLPVFKSNLELSSDLDIEERTPTIAMHIVVVENDWMKRFSSLFFLKRVTAYMLRFYTNCLHRKSGRRPITGPLTPEELQKALLVCIKQTQYVSFSKEYFQLQRKQEIKHNSKLKTFHPYLDSHGILRVGGRLQNASICESNKHQIILPSDDHITVLIIRSAHILLKHSGFHHTWAHLGREYWILRGRDRVRFSIRKCVICRRYRAKAAEQLMGALPPSRVTPTRAFLHTGVDYAGPFMLREKEGRGKKTFKGWMCLFVCMASKAIHLELVLSLSTESFIAALRRFVSRRGLCTNLYSDNGTNFVGAEKELQSYLQRQDINESISRELGTQGIRWHFSPPSAPHHGGLWEAGVKSAKHHLRRTMGNLILSIEQFTTLLCQVEAVLNSRPLYQRSPDPGDMEALTPGHLLTGEALTTVPDIDLRNVPLNRLSLYQLIQNRIQDFWHRWSLEYLNTLQQRRKWMWEKEVVKCGDLVLLVEESPPSTWKMGRVVETYRNEDNLVRTVLIKTATTTLKRPIVKLIPLLSCDESN